MFVDAEDQYDSILEQSPECLSDGHRVCDDQFMPRPYSVDLRERATAAVADGCSIAEAARRFSACPETISRWLRRQQTTGSLAPTAGRAGRPRALAPEQEGALRDRIDAVPDATIDELQAWLAETHAIVVGHGTVWRTIARLDRPRKKRA